MKEKLIYIETSRSTYPMSYNINVMEEIQEQYGSMEKWGKVVENKEEKEPKIKDLKNGLMAMINEGIDIENEDREEKLPFVNSKQVGRIISEVGFAEITSKIQELTINSTKTDEESKNV